MGASPDVGASASSRCRRAHVGGGRFGGAVVRRRRAVHVVDLDGAFDGKPVNIEAPEGCEPTQLEANLALGHADLDLVAKKCAVGAYYNSGQVCISVQRIYSQQGISDPFTEKFVQASEAMVVGDPLNERVDVGPMIDPGEVDRIENWVDEAREAGAQVLTGGAPQ